MKFTETWKPVRGYEGRYEVSDLGRLRTVAGKMLKVSPCGNGCNRVYLNDGTKAGLRRLAVRRMVLEAFAGPPPTAMHKVGVRSGICKTDDRLINLFWSDGSERVSQKKAPPTEKEIAAACAEIRSSWSERERQSRIAVPSGRTPWTLPEVAVGECPVQIQMMLESINRDDVFDFKSEAVLRR